MSHSRQTRISVALCTYNGERFLPQQLDSIAKQTRLPDELVVCDDRSTDRTAEIVREFAASVSFPVKLVENDENLGSTKNFEKAIGLCSGDLIALCDQDDKWFPVRLERCEQELLAHPEVGLVFSDGDIIDDQNLPIGKTLWQTFHFTAALRRELLAGNYDLLVKYRFVTGATVMVRAGLRDRFLPIPSGWIHDEWIAAIVQAFSDLNPIDEPLVFYRQHTSQQVGSPVEDTAGSAIKDHWNTLAEGEKTDTYWKGHARNIGFAQTVCSALSGMPLGERGRRVFSAYEAWLRFALFRANLPRRRLSRLAPVLKKYSWYARHAFGFKSAVKDLVRSRP
jgi:glycosyltransferase involved in cell wall biosynthesis